jgi:glycosyltransferase involved in cell wall biosynthesis
MSDSTLASPRTLSVVIPVFNHERWVAAAVASALSQPEVTEVILVEDGSPDRSLEECQRLAGKDQRVRVVQHPLGANRGASASRNLGVHEAGGTFVAFLDADDLMLPSRFRRTFEVFGDSPNTDGVYEAVGYRFESREALLLHMTDGRELLTTVRRPLDPAEVFWNQSPVGDAGYCNMDGWTFRRRFLMAGGLFNEDLELFEDTEFFIRMSIIGELRPGELAQPVATRRLHSANRISAPRAESDQREAWQKMWASACTWAILRNRSREGHHLAMLALRNRLSAKTPHRSTARHHARSIRQFRSDFQHLGRTFAYRVCFRHYGELALLPVRGAVSRLGSLRSRTG